ncbi:MAG: T9SS type A sorting domain-containing protein [Cyclobacteriaceae bacterium]
MLKIKINRIFAISVLCLLALSESAVAQLSEQEYAKYWYYRHRLRTEFMVLGQGPECSDGRGAEFGGNLGYSIPAHQIYTRANNIKWADGTIDLGFYIAVLATEYQLLNDGGHDTENTLAELYMALKAYERLDNFSFNRIGGSEDCRYDGYFTRDDVHEDIFSENPVFDKYKDGSGNYNYASDYKNTYEREADKVKTITPDQLHSMLLGFAMVKKCLGSTNYNGFNFKAKVIEYAVKTANYLEDRNWVVRDEKEEKNDLAKVFRKEGHAWVTAKAVGYLSDEHKSKDFLNEVSPITRATMKAAIGVQTDIFFSLKDFTIAHMGAGFAVGDAGNNHSGIDTESFLKAIRRSGRWGAGSLGLGGIYPDYDIYYLIWNFLRDKNADLVDSHNIERQLKNAPCYGTMYRPYGIDEDHPYYLGEAGWRASNKWFRGFNRDGNEKDNNVTHGLDYMLAYNVFLLYYKDKIPLKVGNLPYMRPGGFSITLDNPTSVSHDLYAFNDLTASANLTLTRDVEILSKKTLLRPGFRFKAENHSLRLVGGPRNACGDILDAYGDIETLDNEVIFPGSAQRSDNSEILTGNSEEDDVVSEADRNLKIKKKSYKPLARFLEENSKMSIKSTNYADQHGQQEVFVYPNPASTVLNISLPDNKTGFAVELLSLDGRILQREEYPARTSAIQLDINKSESNSVLLVKIITGQHVTIKKIIVE